MYGMSRDDEKSNKELNSWKEIADFLGVTVRTAQRYEKQMSLPIRRLAGTKGAAVTAASNELAAWKQRVGPIRWWNEPAFLKPYAAFTTVLVIAFGGLGIVQFLQRAKLGKPFASQWMQSTLVVADDQGRELWRKAFFAPPLPAENSLPRHHLDLDGDGTVETIVPHVTAYRESKGGALHCLSEKGEELWRLQPKRAVSTKTQEYSTLYVLRAYEVFPSPARDGTSWVAAVFVHHYSFPSVLLVLDGKGKQQGEYWHSGHFVDVHAADLDQDGIQEILAAGASNPLKGAVVRVFDPRKVDGAQVLPAGHPDQLLGFSAGKENATILFERTRYNKFLGGLNFAEWIGPSTGANVRSFQVSVSEHLDKRMGYLVYTIRSDLTLASVTPSQSLLETYRELSMKDPASPPFGEQDLERLRAGYTLRWGSLGR